MSGLPELFENSIAEQFKIERQSRDYVLVENNLRYQFRSSSNQSAGFRVETQDLKLFSGNPPTGIAKICDALFVVRHQEKDFIIAVEIKTRHKNDYRKQLHNGGRLCEWLVQLFRDHGHYSSSPHYVGLLIRSGNPSQLSKNLTVAGGNFEITSDSAAPLNKVFKSDQKNISLQELCKAI